MDDWASPRVGRVLILHNVARRIKRRGKEFTIRGESYYIKPEPDKGGKEEKASIRTEQKKRFVLKNENHLSGPLANTQKPRLQESVGTPRKLCIWEIHNENAITSRRNRNRGRFRVKEEERNIGRTTIK